MKRNIESFKSNGYTVKIVTPLNCDCGIENLKNEIQSMAINWFNFSDGDSYYSNSNAEYIVLIDHDVKIVKLIRA